MDLLDSIAEQMSIDEYGMSYCDLPPDIAMMVYTEACCEALVGKDRQDDYTI